MSKKIALFVDGANVFYAQRNNDFWIDWVAIQSYLEKTYGTTLDSANYYIGEHMPPPAKSQKFVKFLQHNQFTIVTKAIKTLIDDKTGKRIQKANLDIEIAIDMIYAMPQYDIAVLMSGDGDFERVAKIIKDNGKAIYVYSEKTTISQELKNIVGRHYIDFTTIEEIKRPPIV